MTAPRRIKGDPWDERWDRSSQRGGEGGGGPKPVDQRIVSVTPWWKDPLPGSQDFLTILKTAPLAGNTTIKPAGLLTQIQGGYVAVIKFVTIFIDAPTTTLDVDWILLIGDSPVPGWKMSSFPRNATNLSITFDATIRVPDGAQIGMAIQNNEATARVVGASYGGWQTPKNLIDTLFGANSLQ